MAEDQGDKTEDPTPRRREEAREQGNVARSTDLTAASMLVGSLVLLNWSGGKIFGAMKAVVERMLSVNSLASVDSKSATDGLASMVFFMGAAMLPLMGGILVIAILVNVAQVGLHLNTSKLAPNFEALNPVAGIGRLFKSQGPMKLVMGLLKMALVSLTAYSAVHSRMNQIVGVELLTFMQIFYLGAQLLYSIGLRVGLLLFVLALIDYLWQRRQIEQSLRMTKQEVKDEMRNMDGDPKLKQRRRQIAQQIAQKKLQKDVPTADVVITNPTEFAIALKYDSSTMHAPRVVAKGQGLIAKRIRELAIAAGVPILERKPLARALYKLVEAGHEIPEEFYSTVAEILAYVYELTGKARLKKAV
jgi:flagellar biosynthetic protein FlhB